MDLQQSINARAAADYLRDGVALLPSFAAGEALAWVNKAIEFARQYPSPFAETITEGETSFFHDFWTYRRNSSIRNLLGLSQIIDTISEVVGEAEGLRFFHDHILHKSPGATATPWHHDRPYYFVKGVNNFSVWITPNSVEEDHSLAFLCGSHLDSREFTPVSFAAGRTMGSHPDFHELTDDDISEMGVSGIKIFRMKPGDAVVFNNKTLHRSLASSAKQERSALSLRFVTASARLTNHFVNAAPPFHKMGLEITESGECPDKWFPTVESFRVRT
jgi:ectoine hydroxylase-related dioxygenase (phytanoyl-CoA dioxygenase family)